MKSDRLYSFKVEDWKSLEVQFAKCFGPTFELVTDNKGSVAEAREVYLEAFVYYTQLLELHGIDLTQRAHEIIYSFSRRIWIQKLRKRHVDVNFVMHQHPFFDMEDAFQEIDSIKERSERSARKLAELGEPSRTLIIEFIGRREDLMKVASRLGFGDEDRAFTQVVKGIMRLVKLTEGKELSADETAIAAMLRYTLDNGHHPPADGNGFDKVSLTMISRVVTMVRSHIIRSERIQILSELQSRIEPSTELSMNPAEPKNKKNMKPALVFAITAAIAVGISAFTAVMISGAARASADQKVPVEDSLSNGIVDLIEMETRQHTAIAFAIHQSGIIVTIADAVAGKRELELMEISGNQGVIADVVYIDKARNIAILNARNPELGSIPYRFSPDEVKIGEALYSLAIQDSTLLYAESYLSSKSSTGHGRIKLDLSTSGSPLMTPHGQIAGMVSHADDGPNGVAYLITADQIKESIDRWATRDVIHVALPNRNQLFYENRANQIEKISQFLYKIEYETEVPVTIP